MFQKSRFGRPTHATPPRPEPLLCAVGDTLCEVRVWTEEEWDLIPTDPQPAPADAGAWGPGRCDDSSGFLAGDVSTRERGAIR